MRLHAAAVLLCALAAGPASATLTPAQLDQTGVAPPPGARLPGGRYIDRGGQAVVLTPSAVPTVLLFADYTCAHLCGPGLTLTAGALRDAGLRTPRDYRLVVIGMDGDGPAKARAFADTRLGGLDDARRAAHLLTGDAATVAAAEAALGYHAVYDVAADQFAHDAASFVFTPDGRLSRVLPETAATPMMMRGAIASAARGEVALPQPGALQRIVAVCYGVATAHGVYGARIVAILRTLGVLTLAALGFVLWRLSRSRAGAA